MHTGTYDVSSGIGLLGIVHATLLDEFMNVVQKERNKYQVILRTRAHTRI